MKSNGKKTPYLMVAGLLAILFIISSACMVTDLASGKPTSIVVNLSETQINDLVQRANQNFNEDQTLLKQTDSVDLQPGLIRVFGKYQTPDGSLADGSYDFVMTTKDGKLDVQVTAVNIGNMTMDDPRVTNINQRLKDEFAKAASESEGSVTFDTVEITDTTLKMTLTVQAK
jgi:hypothetical protein